jgi:hypothetical protein
VPERVGELPRPASHLVNSPAGPVDSPVHSPADPPLAIRPAHTCAGVFQKHKSKRMKPLLLCQANYGLPSDSYQIGYCGVDNDPQLVFSTKYAGIHNANLQKDSRFRCSPCQDLKDKCGRGILQNMKRRLEVTMNIESILKKPFVDEHDVTKYHASVRNHANVKLSEKGLLLKKKADAIIQHDKNVRLLAEKHPDAQVKKALQNRNGTVGA